MKVNDCIQERADYILTDKGAKEKISVRDLQLAILPIMDEIHRVCEKNDIKYALIAGSALGIVNYKGFIPWDDDIDVCIEKKDWNRFIDAMKKDLDDEFYFQCFETDKNYNVLIPSMKVRRKGTCIKEKNFLLNNRCKSGDGIFVDIVIYDNIADNKYIDELNRFWIRLLMPIMVFLDNIHINPLPFKYLVKWHAARYGKKYKNSKYTSQTIAIPWEKFMHPPVFLKKDVYPFKLYEFEGRKYYSYNNIEKVLKEWYGPNCLKKWDGNKWVETLPVEKREPKHTVKLSLKHDYIEGDQPNSIEIMRYLGLLATISLLLALIIFNEASFVFLGIGVIIIGSIFLYMINNK